MANSGTQRTYAYSMSRRTDGTWEATYKITGYVAIAHKRFGEYNVYAPKRLKEILDLLDAKKLNWPNLTLTQGLGGDFDVSWMDSAQETVGYFIKDAELTVEAYQAAKKLLGQDFSALQKSAKDSLKQSYGGKLQGLNLQWEHLPGVHDWFVWGTCKDNTGRTDGVKDGDTITVVIEGRGSSLVGNEMFDIGKQITLRYVGIDTAETQKDFTAADDEQRNDKIAKRYGLANIDQVYDLGIQGKHANQNIMNIAGRKVVLDIDVENGKPKVDGATRDLDQSKWRFVSMIYKSVYDKVDESVMTNDDWYINVNKTLIATASDTNWTDSQGRKRALPLASVSAPYQYSLDNTKFDYATWAQTISIDAQVSMEDIDAQEKQIAADQRKAMENELQKLRTNNGQTKRELQPYTVQGGETLQGIIKDYKSRGIDVSEETIVTLNGIQRDPSGEYILPKGLVINIPVITKVEVINTQNEFKQTSVTHDNTNNFFMAKDDRRTMDSKYHLRIGDVQLIIPPLSISVNRNSNIQKVKTLRTKSSMMTKVGSSQTSITMQLYFHDLDDINGFRVHTSDHIEDYYMDGLRPLIAQFKKAPFLPIENEYFNEVLGIHEICLANLSISTVQGFPHSLAATLTLVEFDPEAYIPHESFLDNLINYPLFRWYYQQPMMNAAASNPYRSYLAPIEGALTNDFKFQLANEEDLVARADAGKELRFYNSPAVFDDKVSQGQNLFGRMKRDGDRAKVAMAHYDRYTELKDKQFPATFNTSSDTYKKIYGADFKIKGAEGAFVAPNLILLSSEEEWNYTWNVFFVKIEAETNINKIPKQYISTHAKGFYEIPYTEVQLIKDIAKGGDDAEKGIRAYKYNYNKLKDRSESTEGQVAMDDYFISDMYITSMSVMYENSFSQVQTQTGEQPTYQYLGSQDPYIQLTLETDNRQAITDLKDLISKADEYSRKYRYGITSGFLGFQNQLAALFGVQTVLVEQCQIHTVPAFPNRFQVSLTLCAFDKTQKRSETLQGMTAASSTSMYDRYVTRDPSQADAIVIERKMKDLELYPDLELPTYEEVNKILPYIGAGFDIYHNETAAKFVDPDFYISIGWTYRKHIKDFIDQNKKKDDFAQLVLQDFTGVKGTTDASSDIFFKPDPASKEILDKVGEKTDSYAILESSQPLYGPFIAPVQGVPAMGSNLSSSGSGGTKEDADSLKEWVKTRSNLTSRPSGIDIMKWYGIAQGDDNYVNSDSVALENPTPLDMYKEIYKWVDQLWLANDYVYDDRQNWETVKDITYADVEDIAAAYYNYLKNIGDGRFKIAPDKADGKAIGWAIFNKTKGLITRERLANYLKAIYHQESQWKQFDEKGRPVIGGSSTDPSTGLGQISIINNADSITEGQRVTWDWKYNLEKSIKLIFGKWERAWQSDQAEIRCRPWDWMVRWYNLPAAHAGYLDQKDPAYNERGTYWVNEVMPKFKDWYNSETNRFNTPSHPQNQDIVNYLRGATGLTLAVMPGNPEDLIKAITDLNGFIGQELHQQPYTRDELAKMSTQALTGIYTEINQKFQAHHGTGQNYAQNREYTQFQEMQKALKYNSLVNQDSPHELFKDQFNDILEYDHRGRLLRAFPTFQMFIIDEGRWMASYKLWDNLYGFNAIQSIDVHKSRKIAADTAIITMTNVYSNLTSRRIDEDYGDWSYSLWDNLIWGEPSQVLLDARKDLVSTMMLETGARIHLRMGYGSDATSLPVMFNGTITELDTSDVVTIVAQGDGLELTNIITADPSEMNTGALGKIIEPRDLLCKLLTSKGNWFKDVINYKTGGVLFKDHPLGIMHFGNPVKVPAVNVSPGAIFGWYGEEAEAGETVQNIYSSNGENTFSQYRYQDGRKIVSNKSYSFSDLFNLRWANGDGDEADVKMKMYGMTTWDVAQTLAYVSPDYIAAVHPFEMRSTLFFGKPYYKIAYRYDSTYKWNTESKLWERTVTSENRKPFQQFHVFLSDTDIVSNRIKASEEGVYTNVVAMVDGKAKAMQSADEDIRYDKQKTKVVDTSLIADWWHRDFWTVDKQGEYYAQSALRDYIKDMYKGSLIVIGDPTVKPHDMCYLGDVLHDMNGAFLVKDVTHSFSMETGFITTISPDAVVVVDDLGTVHQTSWFVSLGIGFTSYFLGKKLAARSLRKLLNSASLLKKGVNWTGNAAGKAMLNLAARLPHDKNDTYYKMFKGLLESYTKTDKPDVQAKLLTKMELALNNIGESLNNVNADKTIKKLGNASRKGLVSLSKGIVKNLKAGENALQFIRLTGVAAGFVTFGISALATIAISLFVETLSEKYKRMKKSRQAVMIVPLQYQGRSFTAGLNGAAGAVVGTKPGKMDQFWMGAGYGGKDDWTKTVGQTLNFILDGDGGLTDNLIDKALGEDPMKDNFDYDINSAMVKKQMYD